MFYILKKGKLRELTARAVKKAGTMRKLEIQIGISRSMICHWHLEKCSIQKHNLNKLLKYLDTSFDQKDVAKILPNNWRQVIGGKNCVARKKERGVFESQLKEVHKASSVHMKKWHRNMKQNEPEKYHLMQYEKFKKIGGYKFITNNGEKVRNKFEKDTADILKDRGFQYEYEPLVRIGERFFFPDFLVNGNIIIECTEWRGHDKAIKLKEKIKYLKKEYKVYVLIPKALKRYYEILNHHLLLGFDDLKKVCKSW